MAFTAPPISSGQPNADTVSNQPEISEPAAQAKVFGAAVMLANIPAVLIGDRIAGKLPIRAIRIAAAVVFAALGLWTLVRGGE